MSLKNRARDWVQSVAANYLGSNIRRYTWTSYLGDTRHNSLGGISYLMPIQGTVVDVCDLFSLVKVSVNKFCVVLNEMLSAPVKVGVRVAISFYNLRRFDGTPADGSEDPSIGGSRTIMLTGTKTRFPVRWEGRYLGVDEKFADRYREIQNPYLRDLITQMEQIPVNGGMRRIVNVLVDAGARNLDFVDPPEEVSATTAPTIRALVATKKFVGVVEILYDRACDYYAIRLTPTPEENLQFPHEPGGQADVCERAGQRLIEEISFEELGDALQVAIDDESWMLAKVAILKPAPKAKAAGTHA